jgi:hypothetical protein
MSVLRFGITIVLLAVGAACAEVTTTTTAVVHKSAPTASPAPVATQAAMPTAPPPQATPPPAAAAPAQAASSTFALTGMGSGSVRVTSGGGVTTIVVSAMGLAPGAHATHVHRGCDGSGAAHLFALFSVVGPSGSSTTTLQMARPAPGWTVIIYPGPAPVGRPVLCATIS